MSDQELRDAMLLEYYGVCDGFSVDSLMTERDESTDGVLPQEVFEFFDSRGIHHLQAPRRLLCFMILGKKASRCSAGYSSCILYIRENVFYVENVRNSEDAIMGAQTGTWVRTKQFIAFEDAWNLFVECRYFDAYQGILSEDDMVRLDATNHVVE